jgi:succinate dehydrogenase hydrophobic anchor subunit
MFDQVVGWEFLQEPLWRWALFLLAISALTFAWNGILELFE